MVSPFRMCPIDGSGCYNKDCCDKCAEVSNTDIDRLAMTTQALIALLRIRVQRLTAMGANVVHWDRSLAAKRGASDLCAELEPKLHAICDCNDDTGKLLDDLWY